MSSSEDLSPSTLSSSRSDALLSFLLLEPLKIFLGHRYGSIPMSSGVGDITAPRRFYFLRIGMTLNRVD